MRFYRFIGLRSPSDWEYGLIVGKLQVRVGRYQLALWWNYRPIINRYWAPIGPQEAQAPPA